MYVQRQVILVETTPFVLHCLVVVFDVFVLLVLQDSYVNRVHRAQLFRLMSAKLINV